MYQHAHPSLSAASNGDHIPSELKDLDQWVMWRYEQRTDRYGVARQTKVPCQSDGRLASSTDAQTWCSYERAYAALADNPGQFAGLGLVFDSADPYFGIDLDDALLEDGNLKHWAAEMVRSFQGAYMEVSPSGRGVKLWARGKLSGPGKQFRISDSERIELYDRGRFFAVTGRLYGNPVDVINDHQADIDRLYGRLAQNRKRSAGAQSGLQPESYSEGRRHDALLREAGRQARRFGGDVDKTPEALSRFNLGQCHPPKGEREVRGIVEWACGQERANKSAELDLLKAYDPEDVGNAQRLVAYFGDRLRYCHAFNKWVVWDGRRWKVDDADQARVLAHEMMTAFALQAVKANEEKVIKFAASCRRTARITNALREAEPLLPITTAELDTHPFLLNFLNGTLDLRTGRLMPHKPEHFITKMLHYDHDPNAQCPLFLAFLSRIMGIHPDASEGELECAGRMVDYLQRALGYSLTGYTIEKVVFLLYGSGDNGKTTLLSTFFHLLLEYAVLLQIDSLMTRRETNNSQADIADLRGARFVMTSETEDGQRLAEGKLKRITQGMGKIKAVRKYENPIEFCESHKLWIDANHLPIVRGTDNAIWNRLHPIPFNVTIPEAEQDKDLQTKLLAEAEGILAWAVEGARRCYSEGLGKPPAVEEANKTWRAESDQLGRFIGDCCVVRENALVQARQLYLAYKKWAEDVGEWAESEKHFAGQMREHGIRKNHKNFGALYDGLELRVMGYGS